MDHFHITILYIFFSFDYVMIKKNEWKSNENVKDMKVRIQRVASRIYLPSDWEKTSICSPDFFFFCQETAKRVYWNFIISYIELNAEEENIRHNSYERNLLIWNDDEVCCDVFALISTVSI